MKGIFWVEKGMKGGPRRDGRGPGKGWKMLDDVRHGFDVREGKVFAVGKNRNVA